MDELVEAYKRAHQPVSTIKDDDGREYEIHRCKLDGMLVFNTQASLHLHEGHHLVQPVILNEIEIQLLERSKNPDEFVELTNV